MHRDGGRKLRRLRPVGAAARVAYIPPQGVPGSHDLALVPRQADARLISYDHANDDEAALPKGRLVDPGFTATQGRGADHTHRLCLPSRWSRRIPSKRAILSSISCIRPATTLAGIGRWAGAAAASGKLRWIRESAKQIKEGLVRHLAGTGTRHRSLPVVSEQGVPPCSLASSTFVASIGAGVLLLSPMHRAKAYGFVGFDFGFPVFAPAPVVYASPPVIYTQQPPYTAAPSGRCYAGAYICPLKRPATIGSFCSCPTNTARAAGGSADRTPSSLATPFEACLAACRSR